MANGRLLILDDDELTGQTMRSIAEHAGMEVRTTTDEERFFASFENWRPDIIALDLIMPRMDGVEVIKALASRGCRAPLIITSGVGNRVLEAAARSARSHGLTIAGILPKPYMPAALRKLLDAALEGPGATAVVQARNRPREPAEADLDRALARDELFVVYQPKVHCQSGALAGFEVLVRWEHPELGVVPPDRFVPLAERSGRIDALTRTVFTKALAWFGTLREGEEPGQGPRLSARTLETLRLSVNVSALSVGNVGLFDWLEAQCQARGVAPDRLILELTETSAMSDPVTSLDMMTRLRMKGFQLSIDDFGTGYSSMLQLVRLPFSEIKVDKSFVLSAGRSEESRSVMRSVVELGRSLGLTTTAEGVEDAETLDYLRHIGCDLAQGYHIARPATAEEILGWIHRHDATRESLRLEALHALEILDTPETPRFDRLTRLAQRLFGVPIALVSLVDEHRQWFKSHPGLEVSETPRDVSICAHAIRGDDVMVVADTERDGRFRSNPLVTGDPGIRFYAGCPLHAPDGSAVGTLSVIDTRPRELDDAGRDLLRELAELVEKELRDREADITDALTGTLSRHGFEGRASDALKISARLGRPAALLFADLNGLRAVNDRLGREEGDRALKTFSGILARTFRESDLVARMGEDEFVVLMLDAEEEEALHARRRLARMLDEHNAGGVRDCCLSVAVGIATVAPEQYKDLQALLAEADARMCADKARRP